MNIRRIFAVFKKQLKDTFKNQSILVQFILYPLLALIMSKVLTGGEIPDNYFINLFAIMFIGAAPTAAMAAIIAEEKEKNTLRVLMMANVKPVEYLIGIGSCILFFSLLSSLSFGIMGTYAGEDFARFIALMMVGTLASITLGAALGILCKNQMSANSIVLPITLVFSVLPVLAQYSENIEKISRITYTQQIGYLIFEISPSDAMFEPLVVIGINMIVFIGIFIFSYKKNGLVD